jgi:hypothetical protein
VSALMCGVAAVVIGLVGFATGHMLPQRAAVDPASTVSRDFAALGEALRGQIGAGSIGAGSSDPSETAAGSSPVAVHCAGSTWPYFDKDCLWGNGEEVARRHKRIVLRLKSPWCNGLRSKEGAYACRRRT